MNLSGLHHVTAICADAVGNHRFYTQVLGMRMVKRTVNQDDTSAYHLFYGDGRATPGSDITFFQWPVPPAKRGTRSIIRTGLRVTGPSALDWWAQRLTAAGVPHGGVFERNGRLTLDFEDPEGQRLSLVDDGGAGAGEVWERSPVPALHQIRGLGPLALSVPDLKPTDMVLRQLLGLRPAGSFQDASLVDGDVHVYAIGDGGPSAELHLAVEPGKPGAREGAGAVHHVALRIPTFEAYDAWARRLADVRYPHSGPVDRHYFRSLYFREPNGILFELATDGPGFDVDEPMETLGETLSLPPFLEPRRQSIEKGLVPLGA
ncbi:MAG: ring-cleaving dioxygenase [Hyphomicrobiales bacterium]|nr:ring-cleaving dioxygenase [Hyphomicrobiales bacterium]